jgi:hypothetical protein
LRTEPRTVLHRTGDNLRERMEKLQERMDERLEKLEEHLEEKSHGCQTELLRTFYVFAESVQPRFQGQNQT